MTEQERNKELVLKFLEASNRNDARAIAEMYAEDGIHSVNGTTLISRIYTKPEMIAAAGGVFAPFPNGLSFELLDMIAERDKVAFEVKSHGLHVSGAVYANEYHWMMRFRDGQIVESKEYVDTQLVHEILCGGVKAPTA
nr:nuclear transport factor 2 family protein [Sphingomonas sp. CDS-1]